MRRTHLSSIITLVLLSFANLGLAASTSKGDDHKELKPCTAYNSANGAFYDLNKIRVHPLENHKKAHKDDREESWHVRGWDYGTNFTMNFCSPVIETLKDVEGIKEDAVKSISAFYRKGDRTYSIGQSSTEPVFRGRKLVLNFTDGSPCGNPSRSLAPRREKHHDDDDDDDDKKDDSKSGHHKSPPDPRRKSTLISFLCERDSLAAKAHISFIGTSPDECAYFFEARSMAACGGVIATQQSVGPWGVFAVIGMIAAGAYLLGGIAYQRTVMHQRGWRQLPNYSLWAGIGGFFRDILIILTSSCARFTPKRRGYSHLSSGRGRRDDEANGLIDSYEEEY